VECELAELSEVEAGTDVSTRAAGLMAHQYPFGWTVAHRRTVPAPAGPLGELVRLGGTKAHQIATLISTPLVGSIEVPRRPRRAAETFGHGPTSDREVIMPGTYLAREAR
jgi:hypothetical protein